MNMNNPASMYNSSSMSDASGSMSMGMTPWLHFGNIDHVLFKTWQPSSPGAVAGTCLGLIVFCILERGLAAYRRFQEVRWRASAQSIARGGGLYRTSTNDLFAHRQLVLPFIPSHDIPRGVLQAVQSIFSYALMLAVMTFNGAYIISIVLGTGVGEALFGRIAR